MQLDVCERIDQMIITSAPGSIMLLGEHAVLHGHTALVAAVNKRIHIQLCPRSDEVIHIKSNLGELTTTLSSVGTAIEPTFEFVLQTIKTEISSLTHGFDLQIKSDFSHDLGLGSSSAVTVALLSALFILTERAWTADELIKKGTRIIKIAQGMGSGADVAAAVLGGIVHYHPITQQCNKVSHTTPITLLYCGFKKKTAHVLADIKTRFKNEVSNYNHICEAIGALVFEGVQHLKNQDWQALGSVMNKQQTLMVKLGVSLPILDEMIQFLKKQTSIYGAKISGSGLGDCVIGLGDFEGDFREALSYPNIRRIPAEISVQGVMCEKD